MQANARSRRRRGDEVDPEEMMLTVALGCLQAKRKEKFREEVVKQKEKIKAELQ